MAKIARKSDGRRIFTDEFKREEIGHVLRGEMTLGELSNKLGIARSLLHRWKRQVPGQMGMDGIDGIDGMDGMEREDGRGRKRAARSSEPHPTQYIRELQLIVGKQTIELERLRVELELLRSKLELVLAELNALKKGRRAKDARRP